MRTCYVLVVRPGLVRSEISPFKFRASSTWTSTSIASDLQESGRSGIGLKHKSDPRGRSTFILCRNITIDKTSWMYSHVHARTNVRALAPSLSLLKRLRSLDLDDNDLDASGASALAPCLRCMTELTLLVGHFHATSEWYTSTDGTLCFNHLKESGTCWYQLSVYISCLAFVYSNRLDCSLPCVVSPGQCHRGLRSPRPVGAHQGPGASGRIEV